MTEDEFASRLNSAGATCYLVGGYVRDSIRGIIPRDRDYLVCGCCEEMFSKLFPQSRKVGKSFPIYLMEIDGVNCEVAFARRCVEKECVQENHLVDFTPSVSIEDDLYMRDTTMNSMALKLPDRKLIDPYNGRKDIEHKIIKAVSKHFCDDPIRALRAARQSAEMQYEIDSVTYEYMKCCKERLRSESTERVFLELRKALQTARPSVFFRALCKGDVLEVVFPYIAALIGKTQPVEFHPEGDAFEHSMDILDKVAESTDSIPARFAALVHDIGKGQTPDDMLPHHYGHDQKGIDILRQWNIEMNLPRDWFQAAMFIIKEHMRAPRLKKAGKIATLLMKFKQAGLSVQDILDVIRADYGDLPYYLKNAEDLIERMEKITGNDAPNDLVGEEIGDWLLMERTKIISRCKCC